MACRVYALWTIIMQDTECGRTAPEAFRIASFVFPAVEVFSEGCMVDGVPVIAPTVSSQYLFVLNSLYSVMAFVTQRNRKNMSEQDSYWCTQCEEIEKVFKLNRRWHQTVKRNIHTAISRGIRDGSLSFDRFVGEAEVPYMSPAEIEELHPSIVRMAPREL
jgi:hypothetical protein